MNLRQMVTVGLMSALALLRTVGGAQPGPEEQFAARMPVREITVFKDGHAFVLHEGSLPTEADGSVVMDYVPAPVLGTFWPYSAEKGVKLRSVTAGQRRRPVERTPIDLRQMLEANVGAEVQVRPKEGPAFDGVIVGLPSRSATETGAAEAAAGRVAPGGDLSVRALNVQPRPEEKGSLVLIKTADGVRAMLVADIKDVTFKGQPKASLTEEESRNMLTLRLDWGKGKPGKEAKVGLTYLQKGVRWIPGYRITLDGKGAAHVELQATLINELTDLQDAAVHLVIGVPTFMFKDTPDPMSLQQAVAQLSQYFREDAQTAFAFSNAIMTQQAMPMRPRTAAPAGPTIDLGPELGEEGRNEDLFVFRLDKITLRKGERMVVPVAEYDLKYQDVFALDVSFAPPPDLPQRLDSNQQRELARMMNAPKVEHRIRLQNQGQYPITTAPAMLLREGRLLAQGMTTYTPVGGASDVTVTTAVDVPVTVTSSETKRTPNAVVWQGDQYAQVDLAGMIQLTNRREGPIRLEITRMLLGNADGADHEGRIEKLNVYDMDRLGLPRPGWWQWYNWPYWWGRFNGIGQVSWTLDLEPGKDVELGCTWHYLYR